MLLPTLVLSSKTPEGQVAEISRYLNLLVRELEEENREMREMISKLNKEIEQERRKT